MNGRVVDGHYYLGSHGRYVEVSQGLFTYSYYHALSVGFGIAIFFWAAWKLSQRNSN
jgi:hypothetical protein